jgi:CPA1 family monovalent cation:H+ antiporter
LKALELVLVLLAATAGISQLADRLVLPSPVLLVLGGTLLALIPGLPRPTISPEVVFLIFIPPLLYWSAFNMPWRDFRRHLRSISLLAVGLVLVSMAAVAAVAHALLPALPWSSAFVLGAIVSPPDAVAVAAVTRRLGIPRAIVAILEGEGLVNDATALVAFRMSVAAVVAGSFSLGTAMLEFAWAAAAGVAFGIALGMGIVALRRRPLSAVASNTVSILTPFAAYVPAERFHASGVLAVVAVGLYLERRGPRVLPAQTRTQSIAMWEMISFLLEGLVFILVGLELPVAVAVLREYGIGKLLAAAVALCLAAILVRMAWVFPGAYRLLRRSEPAPPWQNVAFIGWAGLRGADSLVIALSVPLTVGTGAPFPGRDLILFLTFAMIFLSLVGQGLTLKAVIRVLGLKPDPEISRELCEARATLSAVGLVALDGLAADGPGATDAKTALRVKYEHEVHRFLARLVNKRNARDEERVEAYRKLRLRMIAAERDALIVMRDKDAISDDVLREVEHDLDLEQILLEQPPPSGGAFEAAPEVVGDDEQSLSVRRRDQVRSQD